MIDHISYSALKTWYECPYLFKLKEVDKLITFDGNIFTTFGNAIHLVCERLLHDENLEPEKMYEIFSSEFRAKLKGLSTIESILKEEENKKLIKDMTLQVKELFLEILPALKEFFGEFKLIATECNLFEDIKDSKLKFKGFLDLVLYIPETEKYAVIDWKSCSWGWKPEQRSDKVAGYQLALYKHFFAQKAGIPEENIETYFGLLKRTAKQGKKVEIFRITSGKKKISNALEWIKVPIVSIEKGFYLKKSSHCHNCPAKGIHCK